MYFLLIGELNIDIDAVLFEEGALIEYRVDNTLEEIRLDLFY